MQTLITKPVGICIHHSKTRDSDSCSATAIRRVQMGEMGFDEIAYTMICEVVAGEGRIFTGRPSFLQGAHERSLNKTHLSVCLVGDFDVEAPSNEIIELCIRACLSLMLMNPQITPQDVTFHNKHNPKSCPGSLFPETGFLLGLDDAYQNIRGKI